MSKEQGAIETVDEFVAVFSKFVKQGSSKAIILTPKEVDISIYLEELQNKDFIIREYTPEIKDPSTFDVAVDIWYGNIPKIDEFMTLFGDKLTVCLINIPFDVWLSRVMNLEDQSLKETSKAQYAIMYDELYSQARKGQSYRDAVGTMTTLILHLTIKEKRQFNVVPKIEDLQIQNTSKGDEVNIENSKEEVK